MAPPKGSLNHLVHGKQLRRRGLPSCRLPKKYRFVDRRVDTWRCRVEDAILEAGVLISTPVEALISEACDCERSRQFLAGRLRDVDSQPLSVEIELVKTIRELGRQRNAILAKLFPENIAIPTPSDPWSVFDLVSQRQKSVPRTTDDKEARSQDESGVENG